MQLLGKRVTEALQQSDTHPLSGARRTRLWRDCDEVAARVHVLPEAVDDLVLTLYERDDFSAAAEQVRWRCLRND